MLTLDLKVELPDKIFQRLQDEAQRRNLPLDEMVSAALLDYFDEPSDEEILNTIRESMQDALAGRVRPIDEVLAELKQEFDFDANES
jgi:predicted transcriptional regulator